MFWLIKICGGITVLRQTNIPYPGCGLKKSRKLIEESRKIVDNEFVKNVTQTWFKGV